jgi:hypothetical protein
LAASIFQSFRAWFPSDSGYVVGISEHVGHALTWKILDATTNKVLHRSLCRPITDDALNMRAVKDIEKNSTERPLIQTRFFDDVTTTDTWDVGRNDTDIDNMDIQKGQSHKNVVASFEDLIGRSFLKDEVDGQRYRARIVDMVDKHDDLLSKHPERVRFLCTMDQDGKEEILSYNQIMDYLNRDLENPVLWKFKRIVSHQGP